MPLYLNGTEGVSGINGTNSTPANRGSDTNTGIVYGTDTVQIATGGTTAVTVDSSQNVGIGTASPSGILHTYATNGVNWFESPGVSSVSLQFKTNSSNRFRIGIPSASADLAFWSDAGTTERMRIDSSGSLLVGVTSDPSNAGQYGVSFYKGSNGYEFHSRGNGTGVNYVGVFYNGNGTVGNINTSGSATAYATSSDYRLKENIQPMQNALAIVSQLNPVTFKWKIDRTDGQGFIAHELQAVIPDAVTGEKDAVDADGNPVYQGVDTSFLVATLTAAIKELSAKLDAAEARIAALEAK